MVSCQLVEFDTDFARFPFEVEGGGFGFQRALVGIEQFENRRFAGAIGGFGNAHQIGGRGDSFTAVALGGGDQLRELPVQADEFADLRAPVKR